MSPPDLSAAVDAILAARAELARLEEAVAPPRQKPRMVRRREIRKPRKPRKARPAQKPRRHPGRAARSAREPGSIAPVPSERAEGAAEIPALLPAPAKPRSPRPRAKPDAPVREPLAVNGVEITFGPDADVTYAERTTEVTERQAELLAVLAPAMPMPVGRDFIAGRLWANPPTHADVMLGEIASSLKAALPGIGLQLKTVRGVGIALQPLET